MDISVSLLAQNIFHRRAAGSALGTDTYQDPETPIEARSEQTIRNGSRSSSVDNLNRLIHRNELETLHETIS